MRTTYYAGRRGGHCPGHIRETFLEAIEVYSNWNGGGPEPTVELQVNYESRQIPISKAARLVWNCSDILPSDAWRTVEDADLRELVKRRTYAAVARAMVPRISHKLTRGE
jgi:hypothetical protein